MGIKLANNAISRLSAGISPTDTTIVLVPGSGSSFPALGAGDYFPATIVKADGSLEIVKVTARSADVLTVVRAQENTTAKAFNAGDRIELRMTAGTYAAQVVAQEERIASQNNLRDSGDDLTPEPKWPLFPRLTTDNADISDILNAHGQAAADAIAQIKLAIPYVVPSWFPSFQEAVTYATTNSVELRADGTFPISSGLSVSGTLRMSGNTKFVASVAMDAVLNIAGKIIHEGDLVIDCANLASYGIKGAGWGRSRFSYLDITRAVIWGIFSQASGNNNAVNLDHLRVTQCGSSGNITFTKAADEGSANALSQRSLLDLGAALPSDVSYISYNGNAYAVTQVVNSTKIRVFPRLPDASGVFKYYRGGGVGVPQYGDNGVWQVGFADIQGNPGVGYMCKALYGHDLNSLKCQGNGIGITFGQASSSSVTIGISLNLPYFELNDIDVVKETSGSTVSFVEPVPSTFKMTDLPRLANVVQFGAQGTSIMRAGAFYGSRHEYRDNPSSVTVRSGVTEFINSSTGATADLPVTLSAPDTGVFSYEIYAAGFLRRRMVLTPPAGYTIEGASTYALAPRLRTYYKLMIEGTDIKIFAGNDQLDVQLYATLSRSLAAIANGATETTTVSVPGAQVGDFVTVGWGASLPPNVQRVNIRAYVSATDTVTLELTNVSGASVSVGTGTWYFMVEPNPTV